MLVGGWEAGERNAGLTDGKYPGALRSLCTADLGLEADDGDLEGSLGDIGSEARPFEGRGISTESMNS